MFEPTVTKKTLGQHWLYDELALQAICQAANLTADDTVLEIGPGLGTLTEQLVKQANRVIVIELDESLAADLPGRVKASNLEIVHEDILQFDFTKMPPNYKIVANIPYYLTSNLIRVLSESSNPPTTAVLLVQKEVAERLAANPGNMSILSVTAQFYWQVELGRTLEAKLFTPPPKVDSQIAILKHRPQPLFKDVEPKLYFRLVRAGFSQKRKTLVNSLSGGLAITKEQAKKLLNKAKIMPNSRAQVLSLEDWHKLYQAQTRDLPPSLL